MRIASSLKLLGDLHFNVVALNHIKWFFHILNLLNILLPEELY